MSDVTAPVSAPQARSLVLGAGGFIGSAMAKHLVAQGHWVRGVDLHYPRFEPSACHEFIVGDLRDANFVDSVLRFKGYGSEYNASVPTKMHQCFDFVYQFAADTGGAGFVFTGDNDAAILHNSASINLNVLEKQRQLAEETQQPYPVLFYSGSARVYPEHNQLDPDAPDCRENTAYPANPDSEYGWEKLFSERLYLAYMRNYGMPVRLARYHNIFGANGTWEGGIENSPAAICRKIAELPPDGGTVDVWGDGMQTRSFLHIDECIEGTQRLVNSDFTGPVNIGSDEMVSINDLVGLVSDIAKRKVCINHIPGPLGVRGRKSHNALIYEKLGWRPTKSLRSGLESTYAWIKGEWDRRQQRSAPIRT
jgi:nucleoside-diphosphate-sugar epimerase